MERLAVCRECDSSHSSQKIVAINGQLAAAPYYTRTHCPLLRYNGQCQVIASAAFVVGSELRAVAGEGGPISKITESAENRVGRGVGNNGENCADCERGSTVIDKCKRHVAVNSYAEGGDVRRFRCATVQRAFISRERPKR